MRTISFTIAVVILFLTWFFTEANSPNMLKVLTGSVIIIGTGIWQEVMGIRNFIEKYDSQEDKKEDDPPSQYPYNHT